MENTPALRNWSIACKISPRLFFQELGGIRCKVRDQEGLLLAGGHLLVNAGQVLAEGRFHELHRLQVAYLVGNFSSRVNLVISSFSSRICNVPFIIAQEKANLLYFEA